MKPNSAYKVPTTYREFFANFLRFLKPLHGLSERQITLAAAFLAVRQELSSKITDDELLDAHVLSTEVRKKIKAELGDSQPRFQVTLGDLRREGFIIGNRFNKKYIPNLSKDMKGYQLLIYFPFNQQDNEQSGEESVQ